MKQEKMVSASFMYMGILLCTCLIASNMLESKILQFGSFTMTAGVLCFPISYILNDCIAEVWGYRKASILIWTGFLVNFAFVGIAALADAIPGAPYWENEEGFHAIFGLTPRIALASFVSFLAGSFVNAYVMSRMKVTSQGRNFSLRAIASTLVGEGADSLIFFPLALGGVVPTSALPGLMLSQVVLKTLYEVAVLPLTVRTVKWLKRVEGTDAYDDNISYNVFKISLKNS